MKSNLFFQVLFLVAVLATSCQKESIELLDNSNLNNLSENSNITPAIATTFTVEQYQQLVATNKVRLAGLDNQTSRGTMQSITVPDDFATIQEAVDAASEGANIFVEAGIYTEDVVVSTAGLKLQAKNGVQLIGSITLLEGSDNVTIKKFNIHTETTAIHGFGVSGGQVVQNTITSESGFEGIHYQSCDGVSVKNNSVSGTALGIFFSSVSVQGNGTANDNTILNNTVSGNAIGGIYLQGSCQNNTIMNNTVSEGSEFSNGGIVLLGVSDYLGAPPVLLGECNNNIVKNNNISQHYAGISLYFTSYNNTIGPNNTSNENIFYGVWLYSGASNNNIFNNTVLDNGDCDILIQDGDFPPFAPCVDNTFNNNTYDCFTEL